MSRIRFTGGIRMRLYAIAFLAAGLVTLPIPADAGQTFFGMAAYYSGRGTGLTAAHKTLPFGPASA